MPRFVLSAADAVARARQTNLGYLAPLRAVLIGPRAGLHRYAVEAERASLGAYDNLADQEYAYPGVGDGVVDLGYVKLYAADALLNYFNKYIGSNGSAQPPETHPNRVRAANYVFKTANGVARSAAFYDRDVKVGDVVHVRGTDGGDPVLLETEVTGFAGEAVAAVTGAAAADDNNAATQVLDVAIEQVDGTPFNDVSVTASGAAYESSADGYVTRAYTITVTQSSTGNDATTALLRVRSADGLDDQDDVSPEAFGDPTPVGTKGLTVTFDISAGQSSSSLEGIDEDDLVVGQQWTVEVEQAFTAPTATAAGTYTGDRDTTYVVTVSRGGLYAGATKPQITVTTTNGYDTSGPTSVTAAAAAVAVGSHGVTVAFNQTRLRKGDKYYVAATAEGEGALKTLVLGDDVPEGLRGTEVDVRLFAPRAAVDVPAVRAEPTETTNWAATADEVTVESGIQILDAEFTDGGDLVPVPLESADLYVEYREWLSAGAGTIVSLADPDAVEAALGTVTPDNPLAYAASAALANTAGELAGNPRRPAADTTDRVFCLALGGAPDDAAAWGAALEALENEDEAYQIVPLTDDPAVHALVRAHVLAQSTDEVGFYQTAWLPSKLDETSAIVSEATTADEEAVTATIADDGDGDPRVVTASANAQFVAKGVRAGDTFRINFGVDSAGEATYDEYEVATVTSQTTLVLADGPDTEVTFAVMAEVWREHTKAELVTQLTARAAALNSDRVKLVWPDRVGSGGVTLAGYNLCAALAGLAGSVPSNQGLRNLSPVGFDDLTRSSRMFNNAQLQDLADGGVFVVTQTPGGVPYVLTPNTTDPAAVGTREESIVRNADMIRKAVQAEWGPYVGSGNTVGNLRQLLDGALITLVHKFQANVVSQLGPPVGSITIASMEISSAEGEEDTLVVELNVTGLSVPLNRIRLSLPVSI